MRYLVLLFSALILNVHAQSDFGSSFNPTYGIVQSNIPQDYYLDANDKSSEELIYVSWNFFPIYLDISGKI